MKLTRQTKLLLGYAGVLGGAWFLREAYERCGKERPFFARFLP